MRRTGISTERGIAMLVAATAALLAAAPDARAQLLGITSNGELLDIDYLNDGAGTSLGSTGLSVAESLERTNDGTLIVAAGSGGSYPDALYRVDPADPTSPTLAGTVSPYSDLEALAFDNAGSTLYASGGLDGPEFAAELLLTLDPDDATPTQVGAFQGTVLDVDGLAMSPDDVLWGYDLDGHGDAGARQLVTIDPLTGEATQQASITTGLDTSVFALEFAPDGTLYAALHPNNVGGPATLITIDTTTGAFDTIGDIGHSSVTGLVFVPEPGPGALLASGLVGLGVRQRRRVR